MKIIRTIIVPIVLVTLFWSARAFAQGALTPSGAPAPGMRTLTQVEPRVPISNTGYAITQSGSYFLTANITATGAENGITIDADRVTIDLNGFTIKGNGSASACGIYQENLRDNLTVLDGVVSDWNGASGYGINAQDGALINGIQASSNYTGILTGNGSVISDCIAFENSYRGLRANGGGSIIRDSVAVNNGNLGISSSTDSAVLGCAAHGNGDGGISVGHGCVIKNCLSRANVSHGINTGSSGIIMDCSSYDNGGVGIRVTVGCTVSGCTIKNSDNDGIQVSGDCQITANSSKNSGSAGILVLGSKNRIEGNSLIGNSIGLDIDGSMNYVADNIVQSNTNNYEIATGNLLNILLCEVPETIAWPASVKFAGTLTCSVANSNGITVSANNVAIDLDGHTLKGPGSTSGHGIYQISSFHGMSIRNGKISGWNHGLKGGIYDLGSAGQFDNIQAVSNYYGILISNDSQIRNCNAWENSQYGIKAGSACAIIECVASDNGATGIVVGAGCLITECEITSNDGAGVRAEEGTIIRDCLVRVNIGDGIWSDSDSLITDNLCDNNGNGGFGAGIRAEGSSSRIEDNNTTDNDLGIVASSSGNLIIRNSASNNGTNYVVTGANTVGPIITATGTITNMSPWANFEF